jgi:hypothetical protein
MSWWKEEQEGNKKYVIIRSFDPRFFLIILAISLLPFGLMLIGLLLGR